MTQNNLSFDALLPPDIAEKAEKVGIAKANMDNLSMLLLAILAGAFVALGAIFYTVVITNNGLSFGLSRLVGGLVFCLGLILIVIGGAELFTGNNLIIMATISRKVSIYKLLKNWSLVYFGNFLGSVITAVLIFLSQHHQLEQGQLAQTAIKIAANKCDPNIGFIPFFIKGIYCNAMVCLAVWLCFSARTNTDKILCVIFPISGFVAAGFEHCVANMFFIPRGLLLKSNTPNLIQTIPNVTNLNYYNFFINNLLPVTLGNLLGGTGFVGLTYWLIYRRHNHQN